VPPEALKLPAEELYHPMENGIYLFLMRHELPQKPLAKEQANPYLAVGEPSSAPL